MYITTDEILMDVFDGKCEVIDLMSSLWYENLLRKLDKHVH